MPAKLFDFTPIPQPAAPGRDQALTASPDGSSPLATARLVPLERLIADPDQPRTVFDEEPLGELADSLRAQGMRQPITAYYDDSKERFVVISGERRLIAAARAGLARVPVLVERRPGTEGDKLVLQLAENLVREDLTVPEAARALARLRQLRPKDWLEVARRHGIGRRRAYQYLEHLHDAPPLQAALEAGAISEGHAEELRRAPEERLTFLLEEVVTHGLSVSNTRKLIAAERMVTPPPAGKPTPPLDLKPEPPPVPSTQPTTRRQPLGPMAGAVADTMAAEVPAPPKAPLSPGAALHEEKRRRERSRRLRARLERIASELRNMHLNEVASELTALPEIILQARQARDSLDSFISLLERVQLDKAEAMEQP